jgi:hypothetical protein
MEIGGMRVQWVGGAIRSWPHIMGAEKLLAMAAEMERELHAALRLRVYFLRSAGPKRRMRELRDDGWRCDYDANGVFILGNAQSDAALRRLGAYVTNARYPGHRAAGAGGEDG